MRDLDRIKEKVVIRLDNRQVAYAILGFILVSTGTFAGGVVVGKQMADAVPGTLEELAGLEATDADLDGVREHRRRSKLLARIAPGTGNIEAELARASSRLDPDNPTDAARMEAHRQIATARAVGVTRSLGPVPVEAPAAPAGAGPEALTVIARNPAKEQAALDAGAQVVGGYALQVAAFGSEGPAQVVARQLGAGGHDARVRVVASGETSLYRVEVGQFADAKAAGEFQKGFERTSGYSTVLVPTP